MSFRSVGSRFRSLGAATEHAIAPIFLSFALHDKVRDGPTFLGDCGNKELFHYPKLGLHAKFHMQNRTRLAHCNETNADGFSQFRYELTILTRHVHRMSPKGREMIVKMIVKL